VKQKAPEKVESKKEAKIPSSKSFVQLNEPIHTDDSWQSNIL
jgi:hypothetical protein